MKLNKKKTNAPTTLTQITNELLDGVMVCLSLCMSAQILIVYPYTTYKPITGFGQNLITSIIFPTHQALHNIIRNSYRVIEADKTVIDYFLLVPGKQQRKCT